MGKILIEGEQYEKVLPKGDYPLGTKLYVGVNPDDCYGPRFVHRIIRFPVQDDEDAATYMRPELTVIYNQQEPFIPKPNDPIYFFISWNNIMDQGKHRSDYSHAEGGANYIVLFKEQRELSNYLGSLAVDGGNSIREFCGMQLNYEWGELWGYERSLFRQDIGYPNPERSPRRPRLRSTRARRGHRRRRRG